MGMFRQLTTAEGIALDGLSRKGSLHRLNLEVDGGFVYWIDG